MATIQETLDEIFSEGDEEFLERMEKEYGNLREEMRKELDKGDITPEEAGRKLLESFDFLHYTKKED
jgi:hypothetical protein